MYMSNFKTAGIIIIGNEILSGKVHDVNSYYLTSELRSLGVDVRRISVIPDETEVIGAEAVKFSETYDHVFTSGGVGPTHDDVTMEGIAKGFGVKLSVHPVIRDFLIARYQNNISSPVLKMAEIPEGAEVYLEKGMRFPIVSYKNIFIFPGIPEYLIDKFSSIKDRFRGSSFYLKRLFLSIYESEFAEILNLVVSANPQVQFGSYPIQGNQEYRVIITAESRLPDQLDAALNDLMDKLPGNSIVKVE
jgi:molybdenum cofactor synthesis domain-containing protein